MLTRMIDKKWDLVVNIFRQVCPRRGEKGHDDRRFLQALHYFAVHDVTWRSLPAEFGHWNTIWKRFSRLSLSGTFEAFFQALAACSEGAALSRCSTATARAHVSVAGAKGGRKPGSWPLPRRVWQQNPPQMRYPRPAARLPPDWCRGIRQSAVRNAAQARS